MDDINFGYLGIGLFGAYIFFLNEKPKELKVSVDMFPETKSLFEKRGDPYKRLSGVDQKINKLRKSHK
jgi:hypothetical protein